jgi:two-component system OmpR family sensor kinase
VPRLRRVREAAGRLQRVVAALLALFRSGSDAAAPAGRPRRAAGTAAVERLAIEVDAAHPLSADPDLLAAALLNLLDNALRYGAQNVRIDVPRPDVVRLHDDGPGLAPARRADLQAALARRTTKGAPGSA